MTASLSNLNPPFFNYLTNLVSIFRPRWFLFFGGVAKGKKKDTNHGSFPSWQIVTISGKNHSRWSMVFRLSALRRHNDK